MVSLLCNVSTFENNVSPSLNSLLTKKSCRLYKNCPIQFSESELRQNLSPEQYEITQLAGTERAFTGKFVNHEELGEYTCAVCKHPIFCSSTKFDSKSGWPSFYDVINHDYVSLIQDTSHGMKRVEVICSQCGAHLGHVFEDGPKFTGLRYCINSASLDFKLSDNDKFTRYDNDPLDNSKIEL